MLAISLRHLWPFSQPEAGGAIKSAAEAIYWAGVRHGLVGASVAWVALLLLIGMLTAIVCRRGGIAATCLCGFAGLVIWFGQVHPAGGPEKPAEPSKPHRR